jgi:hypothetical protein
MSADFWQLLIAAVGVLITLGVIYGGSKRLEGNIIARLKSAEENFKAIFEVERNIVNKVSNVEKEMALACKELNDDTVTINRLEKHVDSIEGRVITLETKEGIRSGNSK